MYEARHQPPLSRARFLRRLFSHAILFIGLIGVSLALGMSGYIVFEGLAWTDAFLNAALLVSPVLHRILHRFHWDESNRPGR